MYWEDYLPVIMFLALAFGLFTGIPVAFVVGGVGLLFGFIGWHFDMFALMEFFNIPVRIWGGAVENLVLVAVPCFIFMGTMLERSGVAQDLLEILDVLLKKIPGGLAMSVTIMGTIMAATTGIIGASVVMMTLMALPTMLRAGYAKSLSTGTIAASATLGILIPPSIMLVIMADLLAISVGNLFLGAIFPGLLLSGLYLFYILIIANVKPSMAPRGAGRFACHGPWLTRENGPQGFHPAGIPDGAGVGFNLRRVGHAHRSRRCRRVRRNSPDDLQRPYDRRRAEGSL